MTRFMNQKNKKLTPAASCGRCKLRNDIIFIAALLAIALIAGACMFFLKGEGDTVRVTVDGALFGEYPLSADAKIEIYTGEAAEDLNVLVIRDGKAFVESATCPDGICAAHRAISRDGESIVCLPHRVVIAVYAREDHADIIV